jgi:dephospho-CoA kinase
MSQDNHIPIVGIAGGIASGKSLVTEQLKGHRAAVISADAAAHLVLELEEVKAAARKRWGEAIFAPDGRIDRTAVGRIVFADGPDGTRERAFLEQLTHPRIRQVIDSQLADVAAAQPPAIVLDVPLLFESGWNKICDKVVFVDAPHGLRQARAASRGWTADEFDRREATQMPVATKRQQSDVVIDNGGSLEATAMQVERFWRSLVDQPVGD